MDQTNQEQEQNKNQSAETQVKLEDEENKKDQLIENLNQNQEEQQSQNKIQSDSSMQISKKQSEKEEEENNNNIQIQENFTIDLHEENIQQKKLSIDITTQSEEQARTIIDVVRFTIKQDGLTKTGFYDIQGKYQSQEFLIQRKYIDFCNLRQAMVQRWPGLYIPPIPSKKRLGVTDHLFLEQRMKELDEFCKSIMKYSYLLFSSEFQLFLSTNIVDVEKSLNALQKQSFVEIITKYKQHFQYLSGKEINSEIQVKISNFKQLLDKMKGSLQKFKKMSKIIVKAKKNMSLEFEQLTCNLLPQYEQTCFKEYADTDTYQLIFANGSDQTLENYRQLMKQNASNMDNSIESLLQDYFKKEINEISAIQEALEAKDEYESLNSKYQNKLKDVQAEVSKQLSGKQTIKSIFTKGTKEDKIDALERDIQSKKEDIYHIQMLLSFITVILGYVEIDKFKKEKKQEYIEMLGKVCTFETQKSQQETQFWLHINTSMNQLYSSQ